MFAKIKYRILLMGSIIGFLTSCEKVIDLKLDKSQETVVVDALVSNLPDHSEIRLSKSSPIFSEQSYTLLRDATVQLEDQNNRVYEFLETEEGVYRNPNFLGYEGEKYVLDIQWEGQHIQAESIMPHQVMIDSIELVISQGGIVRDNQVAYSLKVHFTDPVNEANYYRFDVFHNDTLYPGFVVSKDLLFDGISTYQFFMNYEMHVADTIGVLLSSIDQANYNYFLVLGQSNSPFVIAPGNPISNIQGDGIGYFGAFAQSYQTIIVTDKSADSQ